MKIYFDISQTYRNDLQTGIQRVVQRALSEMLAVCVPRDQDVLSVISVSERFCQANLQQRKASRGHKLAGLLKRLYTRLGVIPHLLPCRIRSSLIRALNRFAYSPGGGVDKRRLVEFGDGDVLLLPEANWVNPNWKALEAARKKGVKIVQIIYDLIPIMHPEFAHPESTYMFREWLVKTRQYVDAYISDSKFVADQLAEFMRQNDPAAPLPKINHFVLGADIANAGISDAIREELVDIMSADSGTPAYLCVGTIEQRKNQAYLLDAFEEIWEKCPTAKLILVGRIGWKGNDIAVRLKKHPMLNKVLFMFNDLNDSELAYCYANCKALLIPTLAEGFGLPVVEALAKGLPVFASDLEVLRAVGQDFCTYFNTDDSATLAKLILEIENDDKWPAVRDIAEFHPPTWRESCEQLLDKIQKLLN